MAISSGNLIQKTTYFLQQEVLLVSRAKKNLANIWCSKGRDYSASFPLRYIPKKFSGNEESEASASPLTNRSIYGKKRSSLDSNEKREKLLSEGFQTPIGGRSSAPRVDFQAQEDSLNDFVNCDTEMGVVEEFDGDVLFEDIESMEEPEDVSEKLELSSEKKHNQCFGVEVGRTKQDAEKQAVKLLATRAYTAMELRKKLLARKFPLAIVDTVIRNFQCRGLINDGLYAETYSRSRWTSSTWGPSRIKKTLFSKGISSEDAQKAVKLVFNDAETIGEQDSKFGMSKHSMDHLFVQASKQWQRSCDAPMETRKSRIIRWLQYRGFSWDVIGAVLKKLQAKYPP